jgi:GT2 family glycosyltransferase
VYAGVGAPPSGPPRISVVVCTYNGGRTIDECFRALARLDYPDYEVIVVDDGSMDGAAARAPDYGFRLVTTTNVGLSNARNLGLERASGEIVAYLDDDAYPEPDWLTHLALAFRRTSHVGIGGPNIPPEGDGPIADCIAHAPGGPMHVLVSDVEAEHIPGCNMAFRREALEAVRGFDPQFRIAGDDVDLCWRLQERGWTLGFSPAAVVWHHRRNSVRAYLRQQRNYGRAEALLERKWPDKYNALGHVRWQGRVYGNGFLRSLRTARVYHGSWGSAPFQSLYTPSAGMLGSLPAMPEWYLALTALTVVSALGSMWSPLLGALPVLAAMVLVSIAYVVPSVSGAHFRSRSALQRISQRVLTAMLCLAQPAVRMSGRLSRGLTPWRRRAPMSFRIPRIRSSAVWCEEWIAPDERLVRLEQELLDAGHAVVHGGPFDRWDLEVRAGILGGARLRMAVEDHGSGTQFVRIETRPRWSKSALLIVVILDAVAVSAALSGHWPVFAVLAAGAVALGMGALLEPASAVAVASSLAERPRPVESPLWNGRSPALARSNDRG